jgi:hypothetical protein
MHVCVWAAISKSTALAKDTCIPSVMPCLGKDPSEKCFVFCMEPKYLESVMRGTVESFVSSQHRQIVLNRVPGVHSTAEV